MRLRLLCALLPLMIGSHANAAEKADAYPNLGFDKLASYPFESPGYDPEAAAKPRPSQIPAEIQAFDDKDVTVVGFMLPTKLEGSKVKEFLLVKDQSLCCYGAVPKVNEWVVVAMDEAVPFVPDIPRAVSGRLRVGEAYDNGFMTGVYRMQGRKFGEPK